jgi:hypothetical protein
VNKCDLCERHLDDREEPSSYLVVRGVLRTVGTVARPPRDARRVTLCPPCVATIQRPLANRHATLAARVRGCVSAAIEALGAAPAPLDVLIGEAS